MKKANQSQEETDIQDRRLSDKGKGTNLPFQRPPRGDRQRKNAPVRDPELEAEKLKKREDTSGTPGYKKKNKDTNDDFSLTTRNISQFTPSKENLIELVKIEEKLNICLKFLSDSLSDFYKMKSIDISPDGKLGGRGYVLEIPQIRSMLYESVDNISNIIDALYDEISGNHWSFEDESHEKVKDVMAFVRKNAKKS